MKQTSITEQSGFDLDEAPELKDFDLSKATFKVAGNKVDRDTWQKSALSHVKKQKISITLDPDVIVYFKQKAGDRGYQTLINNALRDAMVQDSVINALRQVINESRA